MTPDPVWPLIVLAAVTAVDGVLCLKPAAFIAQCFTDVRLPRRYWRLASPIKFAAAAGLIAGIWIPFLALLTTCCLIAYFVVAIVMHIRARDLGRNLFVNASGMLLLCLLVLGACFLW
jgi:hypothetical protein